jgi:hypothetical protein
MQKYPLQETITTAYKQLISIFASTASNVVRHAVLAALVSLPPSVAHRHNLHIAQLEHVCLKLGVLLTSNDPIARALTLRLMCVVCVCVKEREELHHPIWTCFNSTTAEEVWKSKKEKKI